LVGGDAAQVAVGHEQGLGAAETDDFGVYGAAIRAVDAAELAEGCGDARGFHHHPAHDLDATLIEGRDGVVDEAQE
jgi:hypothetical protein